MSDGTSSPSRPASPVGALPDFTAARPYRFTWDPSARRGPGSVYSEATQGADYFAANARVDLSGLESPLPVGVFPQDWTSTKQGFHAISTVLNNPHKKQAPPKAHSALPIIAPAELPRVRRKDFDSYLRAIEPEWDRFVQSSSLGRDGAAQIDGPMPLSPVTSKAAFNATTPRTLFFDPDVPTTPRTPRPPPGRQLPPLSTVPSVFFEPNFNLGDPPTFAAVTEQSEGSESDPSSLAHSLTLLEKLSHYADTIELHLIREIAVRSSSFFAALTNLQDLQTESEGCLDRISKMRALLQDVDDKAAKKGLEVVRMENKLRNLGAVREGVKMVGGVVEMTGVAKSLVSAGQWGQALGVVDEMEALWDLEPTSPPTPNGRPKPLPVQPMNGRTSNLFPVPESPSIATVPSSKALGKRPRTLPLSSLHAFASLPHHLRTLTMDIASSLSSELVSVLRTDLLERMQPHIALVHESEGVELNQSLKDRLRPLLQGLVRTKGVREATVSWREVVMLEVRDAVKRHLPVPEPDDDDPGGTSKMKSVSQQGGDFASHLRGISHSEFMDLARTLYKCLLNCIEGIQTQNSAFTAVLESIQSFGTSSSVRDVQEELFDILSSAAELANARASKVISIRSEQHAGLELTEFLVFFDESWGFVVKCEVICRRMIVGLRGVVVTQSKAFLQTFHQTRISRSAKLVEDEQWSPVDLTVAQQRVADVLVESAVRDPPELQLGDKSKPQPDLLPMNGSSVHTSSSGSSANGTKTGLKHLRIEDRTYYSVSATLDVLGLLLDYLKVIVNLPLLTTDAMGRVIEFLKSFNSRTCQVVLGAGAMRSAGLKNITAKHLALASQSLSIMIGLIPYVREAFRRHFNPTQAVMLIEFDKLKRDYQEHQNEIHDKLVAIMGDRLSFHLKTLQAIKWDSPRQGVNEYMEYLVKETVTLHKVLSRYLSGPVVEYVMSQVFAAINHRLSEEYSKIDLPSQEAKERLLADAKFLHQKLSALKGVGAQSAMLETLVADKVVQRKSPFVGNERIKGMLARDNSNGFSASTSSLDSTLSPSPRPHSPRPELSRPETPRLDKALPSPTAPVTPTRTSSLASPVNDLKEKDQPPLPRHNSTPGVGFRQVEIAADTGADDDVIGKDPLPDVPPRPPPENGSVPNHGEVTPPPASTSI